MKNKFIFLVVSLLSYLTMLLIPSVSHADWVHTPVSVDPTASANNGHYNSGGRRIVKINDITFVLVVDGGSDHIHKSTNDGPWSEIDSEYGYSGCLVSGADNYVYHFSRFGGNIRMVKFLYDATTIPAPVNIATDGGTTHGVYRQINATVNEAGDLFVFYHDDNGGSYDTIYMTKSVDNGISWEPRVTIRAGNSEHSWGFVHSDVTPDGDIVIVYSEWESKSIQFAISDNGTAWTHTEIASGDVYNPSILPGENNDLYVFAQSNPDDGLVFKKSTNNGNTWPSNWISIQANHANGYADPSPALGDDGNIYVAFRGTDNYTVYSDDLREYIAMSDDGGTSWSFPFHRNATDGRVGTRSITRYQTWHNYGGPFEWTWLEENGEDTNIYPTLYNLNTDVLIKNITTGLTIRADVNQDSQINTTDAQLTLRNSLGLDMTSTNWQTSSTTGDVNCDLTSNSTDAMLIIRHSLGLSMVGSGWCEE